MAARPIRIFQIAKELNISHTEILSFLKRMNVNVQSHMSPVDEEAYQMIQTEFAKDKASIDRYRKEVVRREIHQTRVKEQQRVHRKLKLLSLEEQRQLEKAEKAKAKAEAEKKAEEERREKERLEKEAQEKAKAQKEVKPAPPKTKRKLKKIDLSEIEAQIGLGASRPRPKETLKQEKPVQKSVKEAVRQTLSKMETKSRKKSYKKEKAKAVEETETVEQRERIEIPEYSKVDELAKLLNVSPSDIIQECLSLGKLTTINQRPDWDLIELLAEAYGYEAVKASEVGSELYTLEETDTDRKQAEPRAPVVTVMGHVDHGKTSLLDFIRKSNIVAGESGGITQHIGAYRVEVEDGKAITFLDTPGHEAFTAMRARGAYVTDIVVLVVAANDGVMPQTVEAINHARAAEVPLIVAINKIDLPDADLDRVKRELSKHDVLVEDWGGKVQAVPISAKYGEGVEELMQSILLEAEVLELKANRNTLARGTVIDSRLDKGYGPIATVLIQKGTLRIGDPFICSNYPGKVRAIMNERNQRIKKAIPSDAVQILGFERVPQVADIFAVVENERDLKRIAAGQQRLKREIEHRRMISHSLDSMSTMIKEGEIKSLPLILKGDVDGSVEALAQTLEKIKNEEVGVQIIHRAVGMITESDVLLAEASNAVIIGFQVQVDPNAKLQAKQAGVEIRTYNVIYNAVEDVRLALEGMLEPETTEEVTGRAVVLTQFKIPKIGFIAGAKVEEGTIVRNLPARLIRDGETIAEGAISSLKRFQDDVREVKEGLECGIGLEGVGKFMEGDIIEVYETKTVKRTLETN
ncbi:MAG: translation initiation factor IF-2 [Fidelibacterota bacterium]